VVEWWLIVGGVLSVLFGRKNRDHAHDGMAATQKSLGFLRDSEF
jgi:hypothetical protein